MRTELMLLTVKQLKRKLDEKNIPFSKGKAKTYYIDLYMKKTNIPQSPTNQNNTESSIDTVSHSMGVTKPSLRYGPYYKVPKKGKYFSESTVYGPNSFKISDQDNDDKIISTTAPTSTPIPSMEINNSMQTGGLFDPVIVDRGSMSPKSTTSDNYIPPAGHSIAESSSSSSTTVGIEAVPQRDDILKSIVMELFNAFKKEIASGTSKTTTKSIASLCFEQLLQRLEENWLNLNGKTKGFIYKNLMNSLSIEDIDNPHQIKSIKKNIIRSMLKDWIEGCNIEFEDFFVEYIIENFAFLFK
jgi:hypothetical protein